VAGTVVTVETTLTNEFTAGCVSSGAVRTVTGAVYGPLRDDNFATFRENGVGLFSSYIF